MPTPGVGTGAIRADMLRFPGIAANRDGLCKKEILGAMKERAAASIRRPSGGK